jgi:hypothetical protein
LLARKFHNMVLGGKVHAAVQMVTNRGAGGSYWLHNLDSKPASPLIGVLCEKHPDSCVPLDNNFDIYPDAPGCLDTMPVYCYEECVAKAAACLSGNAEPCEVESEMLKHWLLRHGMQSECLCNAMTTWVDWLSNGSPPYAVYRAVKMVCTVALDKPLACSCLGWGRYGCVRGQIDPMPRQRWRLPARAAIFSSAQAFDLASKPTSMPSGPFGHSLPGERRMAPALRSTTETCRTMQPCGMFVLRDCWPLRSTSGLLRMLASLAMSMRLALALLCLMPAMTSTSSTITSCCGTLCTNGTTEAGLHSTATGTGYAALSGLSRGSRPF